MRLVSKLAAAACVAAMMMAAPTPVFAEGATRISGIGFFDVDGLCVDPEGAGADYAIILTGDLDGCLYAFVETAAFTDSGTYLETGTEIFVGPDGTFETVYRFEGKYEDPANLVGEIFGRCQHAIVRGSGTGGFEGVTGRIDFKDDVETGDLPYRGSLRFLD